MKYFAESLIAAPPNGCGRLSLMESPIRRGTGVTKVDGRIADGQKVKVYATIANGRAFPVKVALNPPGRMMTWSGGSVFGVAMARRAVSERWKSLCGRRFSTVHKQSPTRYGKLDR